jgi:hypothetical protein
MNMVFLEDDDLYRVPDFRQVDFFNNKNLDKNISQLRRNNERINNLNDNKVNEYYVETKETKSGLSNLPSIQSSERGSGYRSSSHHSLIHRVSSPAIQLKIEEEKNMRFQYNKIFPKKYQQILDNNRPEVKTKTLIDAKSNYKIDEMRSKIFFIKSVYDYTYPQIMVEKLKRMKGIANKIRNKTVDMQAQKYIKKPETDIDRLIVQGHNFDVGSENQLFHFSKNVKPKKNQYEKIFKT